MADDVEYPPTAAALIADSLRRNSRDVIEPPRRHSLGHRSSDPNLNLGGYPLADDSYQAVGYGGVALNSSAVAAALPSQQHDELPQRPPTATMAGLPIAGRGDPQPQQPPAMLPIQGRGQSAGYPNSPVRQQAGAMLPIPGRSPAPPTSGIGMSGPALLPIPGRGGHVLQDAMLPVGGRDDGHDKTSSTLPIPGRGEATLPIPGRGEAMLPIPGRGEAMLPIAGRGEAMLPIAGRGGEAMLPIPGRGEAVLPIAGRGDDQKAMLPIAGRGEDQKTMLPIGGRGDDQKPTLPVGGRGDEQRAMLPIGGRGADLGAMLPISGRGEDPKDMLPTGGYSQHHMISLPLGGGRDSAQEPRTNFVTDTITTPVTSISFPGGSGFGSAFGSQSHPPHRKLPVPMPLASAASPMPEGVYHSGSYGMPIGASSSLPRWARSYSEREQKGRPDSGSSPTTATPSADMQFPSSAMSSGFSNASFRWAGPDAFVQSWHRKLTETYRDYKMMNILGEGRSGAVFIVQHMATDKFYACKGLSKAEHDTKSLLGEIENMKRLDHPNIVRLFETNEDRDTVFLLMELCQGGDLFGRIQDSPSSRLSESTSRAFGHQMLSALAYCHSLGIVHRDVKPENFLLETDDPSCLSLKLADFGIATRIRPMMNMNNRFGSADWGVAGGGTGWSSFVNNDAQLGSLPYMAPELLTSSGKTMLEDAKGQQRLRILAASDLWACGVVIYVMLSGFLPFGEDPNMICSGLPPDFSDELWRSTSEEAKDLILKLVRTSIQERFTARDALMHEWFRGCSPVDGYRSDGSHTFEHSEETLAASRHQVASMLLKSLRNWKQTSKLRRIAITAIAKHLDGNEHKKMAMMVFRVFNDGSEHLKCDQLVRALNNALCEALHTDPSTQQAPSSQQAATSMSGSTMYQSKEAMPSGNSGSARWSRSPEGHTLSGMHIRSRVKQAFSGMGGKRLTRLNEDTPTSGSPVGNSEGYQFVDSGNLASLTELRSLINSLDANKNGIVDYTLLVAALLPEEVYSDEGRISEVFRVFDYQNRGQVTPEDVWKVVRGKGKPEDPAAMATLTDAVKEYDQNGDGMLSHAEFAAMVRSAPKPSLSPSNGQGAPS